MKKVLSVLLCVAMLFSIVCMNAVSASAASTTPSVKIITNEGSPVKDGIETFFCVRFDNFIGVKGLDVTVTAENAKIKDIRTFNLPTAVDNINSKAENFDIINGGSTLRFVDFTTSSSNNCKIIFKTISPDKTAKVSVTGKYAETGDILFHVDDPEPGTFEIKEDIVAIDAAQGTLKQEDVSDTATKFIPYGGVYKENDGEVEYVDKNNDASFTVPGTGYKYSEFNLPKEGTDPIAAFGVSTKIDEKGSLLFGSYSEKDGIASEHGTMIIEGDWLSLKEYYIKNGYTVQQCLKLLSDDYDKKVNGDKRFLSYSVPDKSTLLSTNLISSSTKTIVNVYKFTRTKYMWRNGEGKLEYALRGFNAKEGETYTSIAYYKEAGETHLSFHVKSITETTVSGGETPEEPETPVEPEEPEVEETNMDEDILDNGTLTPAMAKGNVNGVNLDAYNLINTTSHRLYTKSTFIIANCQKVTIPENTKAWIQYYDATGKNIGSPGTWVTGEFTSLNRNAVYFKITLTNSDDTAAPTSGNIKITYTENPILTYTTVEPTFSQGTIDGGKHLSGSKNRVATIDYFPVADYDKVIIKTDYKGFIHFYSDANESSYISNKGWLNGEGEWTISQLVSQAQATGAVYFRLSVGPIDSTVTTLSPETLPAGTVTLTQK